MRFWPGAGAMEGELEAGKRALPPRNGASRRRGTIAVRSRCGCAWRPPFPINRHLGASPEVAPDYWSRRGAGRFKRAGEGLGTPAAAGMVNNFPPAFPGLPIREAPMGRRYRGITGRNAPLMSGDTGPTAPTAAAISVTLGQGPSACQTALRSSRHLLALRAGAILWKAVQPKQRRACRWKSFRCVPALPPNCAG
jgi:hypothetical protein